MNRLIVFLGLAMSLSACSVQPRPPTVPGHAWQSGDLVARVGAQGPTQSPNTTATWRIVSRRPGLLIDRDSRFAIAGVYSNSDGSEDHVDCAVSHDRSEYACQLNGEPMLRLEDGCRSGHVQHGIHRMALHAWVVEGTHVGYQMHDETGEPIGACDLDATWTDVIHIRQGMEQSKVVAVERVAMALLHLWRADENQTPPFICEDLLRSRRQGF
ncbi:MAG: hypothetical protein AB8H86_24425 [Polyangiales bacterium]